MSFSQNLPSRRARPWEVRDRFNALQIVAEMRAGRLRMRQTYDGEPDPRYNQPAGTRSQGIEFLLPVSNVLIARIHRYRQPGYRNTKYDPKWLLDRERGEILLTIRDRDHHCPYCRLRGSFADWDPGLDP